jgi:hypothetical protein
MVDWAMERATNRSWQHLALFGLCGTALTGFVAMNPALASPPVGQRPSFRLDLHPSVSALASVTKASGDKRSEAFPSSLHRPPWGTQTPLQLPDLGAQGPQSRSPSRMEEFARHVHKEGLPVARLWENKSALVSLGLNQRGKPGLWIVQKIH